MAQQPAASPRSTPLGLPRRLRRFALTVIPLLAVLHGYIAWRLLTALPIGALGTSIGVILLGFSTLVLPLGMPARFFVARQVLADRISGLGSLTLGLFSSVFVLTLRRDLSLLLTGQPEFATATAITVLLPAHQPRSAQAAAVAGFDLQLSGHTHGGQFWPWNLLVGLQQSLTAGLHRLDKLWIYTSRGNGYWGPPKRFRAPSEISLLRLVPQVASMVPEFRAGG